MGKFKVDRNKHNTKNLRRSLVDVNPELYRWVKTMAVVTGVTVPCVFNQIIEYAKKNSERITV